MKKRSTTIVDDIVLSKLRVDSSPEYHVLESRDWIRLLRNYLRMTQAELAKRANITQPNLVAIESGKVTPRVSTLQRIYEACLSGLLPMRYSDGKLRPWIPVGSRRRSQNFSGYSPMTRHAQGTLRTCGGQRGLCVPSAGMVVSRTVLPSEGRSSCGAALASPISRFWRALLCNRAIRRCLHGSGGLTW